MKPATPQQRRPVDPRGRRDPRVPFAERRRQQRQAAGRRSVEHTVHPLHPDQRRRDPLVPRRGRTGQRVLIASMALAASLATHVLIVGVGALVGGNEVARREEISQTVRVEIQQPPPAPPPPEVVEPEPTPDEPPPIPRPVARTPRTPPPAPPPEAPKAPPPRVVGLSLESTAEGGTGPSFAVGNTREGTTAKRAADAKNVPSDPGPGPAVAEPPPTNAVASRIPVAGVQYVPPKRKRPSEPPYPETLKAQGVEAQVTVMVSIDATGKVSAVKIIKPAPFPEFNEAARKAALAEQFEPATRDGVPMPYTLGYTYRFRLESE